MKIKVEGEKIVKIVKKIEGIEIVLETPVDAKEGIDLILRKSDLLAQDAFGGLKDIKVTAFQEYKTSAVDYKMVFLIEFLFEEDVPLETRASAIREFQALFDTF
ncbi:MAG TPA: hypothetical protein ENO25_06330 [Desulfobacteraceae bacterium]|jgi:hypothetical protein|nr:hypothetical protein [Desulfobacteraceae bacterium]